MKAARTSALGVVRRIGIGLLTVLFVFMVPAPYVFADGTDPTSPDAPVCTPVTTPPSGLQGPNGADWVTYTYNSCTGLWENPYYTWSPVTKLSTPKEPYIYSCNVTTWQWGYLKWVYSASHANFRQVLFYTPQLPSGAVIAPDSVSPCAPVIQNTGPGSTNTVDSSANGSTTIGNTDSATLNNQLISNALTGDANVMGNTLAGNATSGNALAMLNLINAVQTSSALTGGTVVTFMANINGDVQGDLVIDPSQLQPASNSSSLGSAPNLTMNNQTAGVINNDISLAAASGGSTVASNTTAGNATSGNATAIANVINMLNSMVSAGQSFVGVVNINGNLNGNILMPQSFLDNLIASNAPSTTVSLDSTQASSLNMANTNNLTTTNNVTSSATTGSAAVDHNTSAGNATSGDASTQVRIFNLTGSQVIGANSLLIFVNVSGTWVGVILNAPAGATAAAFGSGLTTNLSGNADIANTTNNAITNNIDVSAASGDATVANNTSAGNATSGNANTAVNLLNMNNSTFNLTGWFGILFINIFGNWYGNLGVYTPPVAPSETPATTNHSATTPPKTFQFVPNNNASPSIADTSTGPSVTDLSATLANATARTLAAAREQQVKNSAFSMQLISGLIVAGGLALFAVERVMSARQGRRTTEA